MKRTIFAALVLLADSQACLAVSSHIDEAWISYSMIGLGALSMLAFCALVLFDGSKEGA